MTLGLRLIPWILLPMAMGAAGEQVGTQGLDSVFRDDFDGTTLGSGWRSLHPEITEAIVSGGSLHLRPLAAGPSASWYAEGEGPLLYRRVRGDFTATVHARAYNPNNPSQPPSPEFRLGGISVRDPFCPPGDHDWAHIALGAGDLGTPIAVEDKSTVDSNSDLRLYPLVTAEGEMRVERRGDRITFYFRALGDNEFRLLRSHDRPDLPDVVQVGLSISSWQEPNDVTLQFDWFVLTQ